MDYAGKAREHADGSVFELTCEHGIGKRIAVAESECDPRILALASKVRYVVDPNNPYPKAYTGHIRMTLRDGTVVEERQGHIRGGAQEPLSRAEIEDKFRGNVAFGGWTRERAEAFLKSIPHFFDAPLDLSSWRG